ncbi:MAG: hypothetical protein U0871_29415 [Gemmataceae bacterium]
MTTVAGWAVVGLIVGLAAWLTGPQRSLLGVIVTAALGVIGAVGCGQLATVVWTERVSSQAGAGLVLAAVGATLVLWAYLAAADGDGRGLPTGA